MKKSKSITVDTRHVKKKKPAPPRPPLPKIAGGSMRQNSVNYNLSSGQGNPPLGSNGSKDLIDFSSLMTSSNRRSSEPVSQQKDRPVEFSYRVGASIFYVPSPLKNHTSSNISSSNPFSPPRPSAQALLSTPTRTSTNSNGASNKTGFSIALKENHQNQMVRKPTIIRASSNTEPFSSHHHNVYKSLTSNSNFSKIQSCLTTNDNSSSMRYENSPLDWDNPPDGGNVLDFSSSRNSSEGNQAKTSSLVQSLTKQLTERVAASDSSNYYDFPPDEDETLNDSSFISPPMPDDPPPPPPAELDEYSHQHSSEYAYSTGQNEEFGPYALALYDYDKLQEGDLPFRVGDVIELIQKIDENWLYGKSNAIEGIFPANHVSVVVPLPNDVSEELNDPTVPLYPETEALYDFEAETDSDLSLKAGEKLKVIGKINDDWLYGEIDGRQGQFPAQFVSQITEVVPYMNL